MILSYVGQRTRALFAVALSSKCWGVLAVTAFAFATSLSNAQAADLLGSAANFAVLAGSTVTNTGPSAVTGDLGGIPIGSISGFPEGTISGTMHGAGSVSSQAHIDLASAYNSLAGMAVDTSLTGQDLGGQTLTGGTYFFSSSAQMTGELILDGGGLSSSLFVFQIGSTLTTANSSSVRLINGATADNIYWQVGSSATLGTGTAFTGSIVALTSITLNAGATIEDGRALARNGAVTMDTNSIRIPTGANVSEAPEPQSVALLLSGLPLLGFAVYRRSRR